MDTWRNDKCCPSHGIRYAAALSLRTMECIAWITLKSVALNNNLYTSSICRTNIRELQPYPNLFCILEVINSPPISLQVSEIILNILFWNSWKIEKYRITNNITCILYSGKRYITSFFVSSKSKILI